MAVKSRSQRTGLTAEIRGVRLPERYGESLESIAEERRVKIPGSAERGECVKVCRTDDQCGSRCAGDS